MKDKGLYMPKMYRSLIFNFSSQDDQFMMVEWIIIWSTSIFRLNAMLFF